MSEQEAGFVITKVEGDGESPMATRKQMVDALKSMPGNKVVMGAVGQDIQAEEPVSTKEELTDEEKKQKKELQQFLLKYVEPPQMGSKFKPEQEKLVLRRKIERQTLGELRRFWGKKVLTADPVDEEIIEEINRKWRDISP